MSRGGSLKERPVDSPKVFSKRFRKDIDEGNLVLLDGTLSPKTGDDL